MCNKVVEYLNFSHNNTSGQKYEKPKVTVIMPIYNASQFLREAVESIISQTFYYFEVLIVDDGSTDGSAEIIKSYRDPRIKLIINKGNLGCWYSRNIGIQIAQGEYIALFDADDVCHPERLEKQVSFLDRNPDIAVVGSQARLIDEKGNVFATLNVPCCPEDIAQTLLEFMCIPNPSAMIRKCIFDKVGLYREDFPAAADYDFFLRASEYYKLANISEALIDYRIHINQLSIQKVKTQRRIANECLQMACARRGIEYRPLTWVDQLQAKPRTLGDEFLKLAYLYQKAGNNRLAIKLAIKATIYAPLCRRCFVLLKKLIIPQILTPRRKSIIAWYRKRLGEVLFEKRDT